MADVELFHPLLDVTIKVPARSAWIRLRNGWEYADPWASEEFPFGASDLPMPQASPAFADVENEKE